MVGAVLALGMLVLLAPAIIYASSLKSWDPLRISTASGFGGKMRLIGYRVMGRFSEIFSVWGKGGAVKPRSLFLCCRS